MKNSRKNKQFQLSLKNRITAIVVASIMLLQILIPGMVSAAQIVSDVYVAQAMVSPLYREANTNAYLYEKAEFAEAVNLQHQSLETFHSKLRDAKFGLSKPSLVPIVGDITVFIPHHKLDKLIGDTYVQSRFIRQQIFNQLGRHISDPTAFATELDQINFLYNNAYAFANENRQYIFGSRLPSELVITRDMVWPEKRNINGQDVIAPIVYLTPTTLQKWSVSDHKIEFFGNSATFKSVVLDHQALNLGRDTWLNTVKGFSSFNGSVASEGNLQLNVGGIFQNIGGSINAANTVNIIAGQILNKTLVHSFTDKYGQGTRLGQVANIQGSNIILRSQNDVIFEGATATATNGTITMSAGGNISILPVFTQYQAKTRDGDWQVTSSSLDVIGSKISATDTIKLIAEGAITINASELVSTEGGIELLASQGIHVLDELTQEQIQKIDRKGRTTGQSSEFRTEAVRAVLSAGKGVLLDTEFGDVTLKASKINSADGAQVYARNGTVHLLMTKELEEKHLQTVRKGTWTIKTRTEDIVHENNLQNTIIGGLQVQAMYGINLEYTGKEGATLAEQVEEFRRMPGMEWAAQLYDQNATAVNWQVMEEVHKELKKTKRNLSPAAMAIIAICVAVATGGAGASLVGAESAGYAAVANAAVTTLSTQAAQSLAAGNSLNETLKSMGSDESLKSLAISMVTAGALEYADVPMFEVPVDDPITTLNLAKQAAQAVVNATITATVSVSINQGNSEDYRNAFNQALAVNAVNQIGNAMTQKIGYLAETGKISEAMQYISLAGSGCIIGLASASASGSSSNSQVCYSGAGGAVAGQFVGNLYSEQKQKEQQELIQKYLQEKGIASTTDFAALSAVEYGKLVAERPRFTSKELSDLKRSGIDLARLSAAIMAFVVGADVDITASAAERSAKYSVFYNFDAAIEAVASIEQYTQVEDLYKLMLDLQAAGASLEKSDALIIQLINSGKFEFLKGLSPVDALVSIVKYLETLNGSDKSFIALELLNGFKEILSYQLAQGRVILNGDKGFVSVKDEVARLQLILSGVNDSDLYDPKVRIESEALFNYLLVHGVDPYDPEYMRRLNALIDLAPLESRDRIRSVVGATYGIADFMANSTAGFAGIIEDIGLTTVTTLDYVLSHLTNEPQFTEGAILFRERLEGLDYLLSNLDKLPGEIVDHYGGELDRAKAAKANGNPMEASKIYVSTGLEILTIFYGLKRVLDSIKSPEGVNDLVVQLEKEDFDAYKDPNSVDGEFHGLPDILPNNVWTSITEFRKFFFENNIQLKDGWTVDRLYNEVLGKPKGERPDPSTYLPANYIAARLAEFDTGVVRITSRNNINNRKFYSGNEGFCIPYSEWQRLKLISNGDITILSKMLGFTTPINPVDIAAVKFNRSDVSSLKVPTGNETPSNPYYGANQLWVPGVKTNNGVTEAVFTVPNDANFIELAF